ncbi:hypothetical protein MPTK1_2g10730 [Marchantia polymorpha subsp. ruderalis]|uniref:Uncharacterized protein n=2 Tax=Marchantia polymorpha TaxID=3197 RepID=A0A176VWC5_MARPO|nr:hypothetical protein AXG93_3217s1340 [Marchantia polymorpha subsp. ruderalis]PTQ43708.1 hypothetical protein MARPO_0023s0040 [Marchantia polymorpha]BBN01845.1 hypothetical protein Mp_2g10730 [Marchantia polymorpha subsp. ruderalis]|eukprot:PTQ43708.1 hypothetical protein MARPO_0023s0040 [Marchantia polymorpha]
MATLNLAVAGATTRAAGARASPISDPSTSRVSVCCSSSSPSSTSCSFSPLSASASSAFSSRSRSLRQLVREIKCRGKVVTLVTPRCEEDGSNSDEKIPFGYTRKDVILIGVGLLGVGVGLKYGLEAFGVDSARAGNAVQLIMVLGLTVGWISSYVFRVSTKEMTYAKQLKDYENKVMQKRLEELPEAELESMLAQIEEEKKILKESRKNMN